MQADRLRMPMSNKKILIVDDESSVLTMLDFLFQSHKDQIESVLANNYAEAIEKYKSDSYDAVILDHNLHGRSGLDFIEETNADNVFYFSGGMIHPESVWPFKNNILNVFQKPEADILYQSVVKFLGIEYKPFQSKEEFAVTTQKEKSLMSSKCTSEFKKHFKKFMGKSHNAYVNGDDGVKINLSKKLLKEGYTVQMVSNRLRYSSRNNFDRFFKQKTGMTASAYRKKYNEK